MSASPLPTTPDDLLAELDAIGKELATIEDRRTELYARRLALYEAGQSLDPAVTQGRMAAAAGVSEDAVTQALRKARLMREAEA